MSAYVVCTVQSYTTLQSSMGSPGVFKIFYCSNIIKIGSLFSLQFISFQRHHCQLVSTMLSEAIRKQFSHIQHCTKKSKYTHVLHTFEYVRIPLSTHYTYRVKECKLDYHRWINAINRRNDAVFDLGEKNQQKQKEKRFYCTHIYTCLVYEWNMQGKCNSQFYVGKSLSLPLFPLFGCLSFS